MGNPGTSFHEFEHAGWENESVCANYDQHLSGVTKQSVEALLEAVGARRGVRLLDIATGAGYVAGAAAKLGAEATGIDFSAMQIALARKAYAGVQFQEADAEALPFAPESFDAVVNAFGMCHLPRPEAALKEALRVLKRGGQLAFTVWAVPERAVAFGAVYAAVKEHGSMDVGLPSGPNFFLFSDPEYSKRALSEAGFASISVREIPQIWRVDSPDRVFDVLTNGSVRAAATLKAQSETAREAIKAQLRKTFSSYRRDGRYEIPAPAILAAAVRP
jgi:ubiquinone/menaquinone biosynthesis C-methylase UbiE